MSVFSAHLAQMCFEVGADLGEHRVQPVDGVRIEHASPVLGHEDHMNVHLEHAWPSAPSIVIDGHRQGGLVARQAIESELIPNGELQRSIRPCSGSCQFVQALAFQKERDERGEKKLGSAEVCERLTEWRNSADTTWFADAPGHPHQQALKALEQADSHLFAKRANFSQFQKKGRSESVRSPGPKPIKVDQANSRLFLPRLGWLRARNSRESLGTMKNVTVSHSCGKWFVAIPMEQEGAPPIPQSLIAFGIDRVLAGFAMLSDGTFSTPLNRFTRQEAALRNVKVSHTWGTARVRGPRVHARIAHARRDFLHKVSTAIGNNRAIVCIEDVRGRTMSKSVAGTVEQPGQSGNQAILDQGWGEFPRPLEDKPAGRGGWLAVVPPQNTSRTCPGAATGRRTTDPRKPGSCVWPAATSTGPIWRGAQHSRSRATDETRAQGRDTPGWSVDRTAVAVGSRNPPK